MDRSDYAERQAELTNEALREGIRLDEILSVTMALLRVIGGMREESKQETGQHKRPDTSDYRIDGELT